MEKIKKSAQGRLLEKFELIESPMGIRYQRLVHAQYKPFQFDRAALVFPRGATTIEIESKTNAGNGGKTPLKIDSRKSAWIPPFAQFEIQGITAIQDLLVLLPNNPYFESMITDNGLLCGDQKFLQLKVSIFRRTKWLDDVLERYFFERVLNRHSPVGCTFFLEKQLINETARILFRDRLVQWKTKEEFSKNGLDLAIRFIEANLFEKLDLGKIAEVAQLSASSLIRHFKKELHETPYSYIKLRRLEEALLLLRRSEHTVGDIAILVGYEDFSSFSKAFRARYGKKPSEID